MAAPLLTAADLAGMRAMQASVMLDLCRVNRADVVEFNRVSASEESVAGELVYEGPCRIQVLGGQTANDRPSGSQPMSVRNLAVALPFREDSDAVQSGQTITVLRSGDPRLLERRYAILSVEVSTFATARRLIAEMIEELDRGH